MATERSLRAMLGWEALALAAGIGVALLLSAQTPVPTDHIALVLRLGRPVRVINAPGPPAPGGLAQDGLAWRMPLIDRVVWLDRRALTLTLDHTPVTTADGQALMVDAYAVWRVTDAVRFYDSLGTPDHASGELRTIMASVVQRELSHATLNDLRRLRSGQGSDGLRAALDRDLAPYGAGVSDLGLSRLALPDGAPLEAAYAQMTVTAEAQSAAIAAQGHKAAQLIRADGQARAGQIYAASFGRDAEFYDFYRAMQSYDAVFAQKTSRSAFVLSPDNAYLRQFRGK